MSSFSVRLVSTLIAVNPLAVKLGGKVIKQLSSMEQDSDWRKQESLVSGKHSRFRQPGKDTRMLSRRRFMDVVFAGKSVQVSVKPARIHSSSSSSLDSGSRSEDVVISPTLVISHN